MPELVKVTALPKKKEDFLKFPSHPGGNHVHAAVFYPKKGLSTKGLWNTKSIISRGEKDHFLEKKTLSAPRGCSPFLSL